MGKRRNALLDMADELMLGVVDGLSERPLRNAGLFARLLNQEACVIVRTQRFRFLLNLHCHTCDLLGSSTRNLTLTHCDVSKTIAYGAKARQRVTFPV